MATTNHLLKFINFTDIKIGKLIRYFLKSFLTRWWTSDGGSLWRVGRSASRLLILDWVLIFILRYDILLLLWDCRGVLILCDFNKLLRLLISFRFFNFLFLKLSILLTFLNRLLLNLLLALVILHILLLSRIKVFAMIYLISHK
jgi:hypothetical protein